MILPYIHSSFSGLIELDAVRLVQSLIQEVQCPVCDSVGKAKVKGRSVMILPHQPLTKRAVRNVTRWIACSCLQVLLEQIGMQTGKADEHTSDGYSIWILQG
jgi:hypothetical protein